ncbi:hypothetical protein [Dietzia cinnamea]|nr:hypothetical protein [Dietzia cinnamea]
MPRIPGYYEWDDASLRPGQKREGGLHQNLFDENGDLKGNARFVEADEVQADAPIVTETVYIPAEERREDAELAALIATLIVVLGTPVVARWWNETARPFVRSRFGGLRKRGKAAAVHESAPKATREGPTELVAAAPDDARPGMSQAEARARYIAAVAAQAFAEEQMRLVSGARIVDAGPGEVDAEWALGGLSALDQQRLIEALVRNPTLLAEDNLAQLASLLVQPAALRELQTTEDDGALGS